MERLLVFGSIGLAAVLQLNAATGKPAKGGIDFNREIRPILSDNCFSCHGPDDKSRKAKLRFDVKEEALKPAKSGDYAIVPGDTKQSQLLARIAPKDPDDLMPPEKTGKKLTRAQIDLLKRWIEQGAPWQEHWAFSSPKAPATPTVKDKKWAKTPVDKFVLAKLESEKLKPSAPADKGILIRRASLDVTGLPPTPQEVDAFLADKSAESYEKLVDRLLATPAYGENMARYWLDAVRYADSHGFHIDSERAIWKYRDWVVEAFNKNMPFDQFTVEQLAGDLLPEPTTDQKVASGYLRCNMSTGEGGAINEEYQAKYAFDRVETTSTVWLGLTMTCARCHTHKYDPIQHDEYYSLYAFFNSLDESVMDGNKPNPDPFMKLPSEEQKRREQELKKLIADAQKKLDAPMPEIDAKQPEWEAKWRSRLSEGWSTLKPEKVESTNGVTFTIAEDGAVLAGGENPAQDVHEVSLAVSPGLLAAFRLEALPHESLPQKSAARADDGNFRLSEFEAELIHPDGEGKPGKPQKIKFREAITDSSRDQNEGAKAIDGKPETGWQAGEGITNSHVALFLPADPITVKSNAILKMRLRYQASTSKRAIGHFRISAAQNAELVAILSPPKPEPWQLIGPFKTENTLAGLTNVYEPETKVDLKKSYPGVREEIKWNAKPDFADGKENLLVQDLHGIHGAYYLYRTVRMPAARAIEVSVRADDLFKLWVNNKLVAERKTKGPEREGALKVPVKLESGENKILLKIVTTQGAAYFAYKTDLSDGDALPADTAALFAATTKFNEAQQKKVRTVYRRLSSPEYKETGDALDKWKEENIALDRAIPTTLIAKEAAKPRDTFILLRGEYDKKSDKVTPGVPAVLPPLPAGVPTNRMGLAKWLIDTNNPLTARVTVNRLWQQFFGVGLVKTTEDFGVQSEAPSHPELLDWLATEFMRSGWDIKHIQRLILLSSTYRQSSKVTPELIARDPENRLLARGPRFRVDAEVLRDTALAVSGLLVDKRGGKSVKPYEPAGLWEAVSFNNSQKYVPDKGDGQHRRSLYTYWKRQSPPPNMLLFDAPTREYCVVRRPRTNTPLQALALMNDLQFVEASRALGQRMLTEGGAAAEARLSYGFRLVTGRKPAKDEAKVLLNVYEQQLGAYKADEEAAAKLLSVGTFKAKEDLNKAELAACTTLANMLLNLDEAITKN